MVRVIGVLFLIVASTLPLKAANPGLPAEIHYISGVASQAAAPVEIQIANGSRYLLAFIPECSVEADTFGVDLSLYRPGENRCEHNLLVPHGNWHGPQPFMFLAWDLVHGAEGSLYGNERVFDLPRLGLRLHVLVKQVDVTAGAPHSPQSTPNDKLESLTIAVSTERYRTAPSPKH